MILTITGAVLCFLAHRLVKKINVSVKIKIVCH